MEIFYSEDLTAQSKQIRLSQEESWHAFKVLRKKVGDNLHITNGKGLMAEGVVTGENSKAVSCDIQSTQKVKPPPEKNIQMALSTIRPNRMDWAVEKLTELGVGTISFFHSQFTSIRTFKTEHLEKIAIGAIKQSGQAYLPQVNKPCSFPDWIHSLPTTGGQIRLIGHLNDNARNISEIPFGNLDPTKSSAIIAIGPEGGFSEEELSMACERDFRIVSLDNHILRSETAAVVAATQAKFFLRKIIKGL